jgi:hypothetical protein
LNFFDTFSSHLTSKVLKQLKSKREPLRRGKMLKKSICTIIAALFLAQSVPAFADRGDGGRGGGGRRGYDDRGFHGGHYGYVAHRIPAFYRTVFWAGLSYLYAEGLFYRYTPAGYIVVEPPVGAMVPALPPGYTTVVVQRRPYYYYADTYYAQAPSGYVVAEPPAAPVSVTAPAPATTVAPSAPAVQPVPANAVNQAVKAEDKTDVDTFEIHIPNDNGSYTLVTLKKTEKGFLGPQGEFYPDHPTVEQLKARYAKK